LRPLNLLICHDHARRPAGVDVEDHEMIRVLHFPPSRTDADEEMYSCPD